MKSKPLIIVESPAKCKAIEGYTDYTYNVMASFGHFRNLTDLKSINMDTYALQFTLSQEKQKNVAKLKTAIQNASSVIIATDDDREGEAIGWHLCDYFKLPVQTTPRILFHEITKPAILQALKNPTTLNMNMVHAQNARQFIDMYIGFSISPILWKYINRNNSLSAGRCQTPALNLIYDNHEEYINQTPNYVYEVEGYFTRMNLLFHLNNKFEKFEDLEDFFDESATFEHILNIEPSKKCSIEPPEPLITSSIQQHASNNFHMSPKETMKICQKLYENGFINYMRTDSKKYSKEFLKVCFQFIEQKYGDEYSNKTLMNEENDNDSDKANSTAQEAHEALRVINLEITKLPKEFTPREQTLYSFIYNHTLETCMKSAEVMRCNAIVSAPKESKYTYKCESILFPGWRIVNKNFEDQGKIYNFIQKLKKGQELEFEKITSSVHIQKSKSHYSEASLIRTLEKKNIGRPSTYASIVDKLYTRNYVAKKDVKGIEKTFPILTMENGDEITIETTNETKVFQNEKNKMVMEELGINVIQLCMTHFTDLFNYEFTAKMEDLLDDVANNKTSYKELCEFFKTTVDSCVKAHKQAMPEKEKIMVDDTYEVCQTKYGLALKWKNSDTKKTEFTPIKSSFTMDDFRKRIITFEQCAQVDKYIGTHEGNEVYLANGKFGDYLKYNGENVSIPKDTLVSLKSIDDLNISHVYDILQAKKEKSNNILRKIDGELYIANGKYGPYCYYKTAVMNKASFVSLKYYQGDYMNDEANNIYRFVKEQIQKPKAAKGPKQYGSIFKGKNYS